MSESTEQTGRGGQAPGRVVWITGLSGAGKSSAARHLIDALRTGEADRPVVLDGDAVRAAVADPACGYDRDSRLANAYRIARFAKLLSDQGHTVVVATISLFHEVHGWNRANMARYVEVFLDTDAAHLHRRDPKKIYAGARDVHGGSVYGFDIEPEFPRAPDVRVANLFEETALDAAIAAILKAYRSA